MGPAEIQRSISAGGSARQKRDYWNEIAAQAIEPVDFRTPDWESFSASLRSRKLGTRDLTLIHSAPWQTSTTSEMVSKRRCERVTVSICLAGQYTYDHEGFTATISPGKAAVIDSLRVHRLRGDEPAKVLCLSLDRADLGGALKAIEGPIVLSDSDPIAAVTLHFIKKAWTSLPQLDTDQRALLQARAGRMVAESVARHDPQADPLSSHVLAMIYRAKQIVMQRIGDVDFGPIALAETMGVNRRYLSNLFHSIEDTPADYIRRVRLHAAWDMLTDAGCHLQIAEIGARLGFNSASQFAKAVKGAFAVTPADIRRMKLA